MSNEEIPDEQEQVTEQKETTATDRQKKKAEIEATLFATNGLNIYELTKRTGFDKNEVKELLEELEMEHLRDERGIQIVQEGDFWKMSVKPEITPKVKDIMPPEMPVSLVKTLAIIAANKPVKQSTIIHVRGNKAYGHIKKLIKMGFITAERRGLTNVLDLTEKFFKYFNVPEKVLEAAIKRQENEENPKE